MGNTSEIDDSFRCAEILRHLKNMLAGKIVGRTEFATNAVGVAFDAEEELPPPEAIAAQLHTGILKHGPRILACPLSIRGVIPAACCTDADTGLSVVWAYRPATHQYEVSTQISKG